MTELHLPNGVTYTINHTNHTTTSRFPDGTTCHGNAHFTQEDHARARALGYHGRYDGDATWRMHQEHDLLHHVVAQALGWPYSQVLHLAAQGATHFPVGIYQLEERMAFLVARATNVGVNGLLETT